MNTRTGSAKADGEIPLSIHRCTPHPAPRCVRLVSALLINRDGTGSHIAQFKPTDACCAGRAYSEIADHGFVIAEVPVGQAKHQTVPDAVEVV